jgi:hypothetical protein
MKKLIAIIGLIGLTLVASAQTNPPPTQSSFFDSALGYFSSFNTNLDSTFGLEKGTVWTGVDSIQGGEVNLANALGISYDLYKSVSVESVTRNSGIAGTLLSEQVGVGLSFVVHDAKLTVYADGGYGFAKEKSSTADRIYGEIGLRVQKALTTHTFAGLGIGAQLPKNSQVFSAFAGITF